MTLNTRDTESMDIESSVTEFRHVITQDLLGKINALIDIEHREAGPDGPRGLHVSSALAGQIAEIVRSLPAFAALEANTKLIATKTLLVLNAKNKVNAHPLHIVRCVDPRVSRESHCRHYDSHILTLLVPLQLAEQSGPNGDLLVYLPSRPVPSVTRNIGAKLKHGIQRSLPFATRAFLTDRDVRTGRCVRVSCTPGSVYAFNGFISKHANLDIAAGQRRSLLIHWFDPGRSGGVSRAMRFARRISGNTSRILQRGKNAP